MSRKSKRASLGVALIARDAEDTITRCLKSFRPFVEQIVVCVDELSTDRTAKKAKLAGADLVPTIKVSDWHECGDHGKILVQHFAEARNQSFTHLDPALDWWMWVDADDVLQSADQLPRICEELKANNALGAWFPYDYGNVQGRVTTLFHRERILRSEVGWNWRYRVHEVVEPKGDQRAGWQIRDEVRFVHQDHPRTESSAQRNLRLLEIDYEEDPNDCRTLFYLGNQYFAMQEWEDAAFWYEQLLTRDTNPYQRWQGAVYLSNALLSMGNVDGAERASLQAVATMPQHPEPYYQLAAIAKQRDDMERCLYWTRESRTNKVEPPWFVFKNPLEYTFTHRVVVADALARIGRVPEARFELEQAAQVLPDNGVVENISRLRRLENSAEVASAYAVLANPLNDEQKIALWEALDFPPEVRQFGRARDAVMPAYLRQRPNTQPRIVFWCGRGAEEWSPESLNSTGIGGSETAVVEIARRFGAAGWRVDVYNGAGRYEGVYDGVGYWEPERFDGVREGEVAVSWRQPAAHPQLQHCGPTLLWCHDLNYGPVDSMRRFDIVMGVSQWHANMLSRYYGIETDYVPNGINLERFSEKRRRQPMQCVYTSSPDRGLEGLLHLWPRIVEQEPGAKLVIAYGWDNYDKFTAMRNSGQMAQWKEHMLALIEQTPNVEQVGRLPQDKLAELFLESYTWLYPTQFLEVSCITAMEAMAGGCVPVTSSVGALPETIGGFGVSIPMMPWSRAFADFFVLSTVAVLREANLREPLSLNGPKRAAELTWDKSFEKWQQIVEGLLGNQPGDFCAEERELAAV